MKKHLFISAKGSALISVIIVLPFLLLIAFNYTQYGVSNLNLARQDKFRTQTQMTADAGIDFAMQQLNDDTSWTGTGGEQTFDTFDNIKTTYEITVTDVSSTKKVLTSIAKTYSPSTALTPESTVTINADLRPVSSGTYSIVTGVGGLIMENSAKVLGGDVYVNGSISMKNTAQIGLALSPTNLSVAHQTCPNPADATYPRVCTSGENGQPITIENSATVYGSVRANNQTTTTGLQSPGLVSSSGVATQPLPTHDRAAQKAAITTTVTGASASCTTNGGTKTWAANTKITGNVVIEKSCKVTMMGDVWITGTLQMKNSGQIIVSNSLGSTRPDLMIDGSSVSLNNTSQLVSNSSNTGLQLISYYSTASCSPDCTDITGTALKTSRDHIGIELDNTASGPQSIFYARWTTVKISNSGQIGALIGQTVWLKNTGTITFGTSVSSGTSFWVLDGYRRSF